MSNQSLELDLSPLSFARYKLCPPQLSSTTIKRRKLLPDFVNQTKFSAVIIQAPAGHGKTTLMRQIKQQCDDNQVPTGWLTLDETDNDISRFNVLFRSLLKSVVETHLDKKLPHLPSQGAGSVEDILQILSLTEGPLAIFIDEFQTISEKVNISLLETIIERIPPNICFYIGTREIPDLAKGRLMIGGQIRWVEPEDLCFNLEEVQEFLRLVGLEISELESKAFLEQTSGWPAILQLLHLALKGGKVDTTTLSAWMKGCGKQLAVYLADNVMMSLSDESKEFLLKTSVLSRLTAPLCESVTGFKDSVQMLDNLVSQGLFIQPIDYEKKWFKYHSIFSGYLAEQLEGYEPGITVGIHKKAAQWFLRNNLPREAIEHALKAGNYNKAADTLSRWIPELVCSARLQTIDILCKKLPESAFFNRPFLCWGRIWAKFFLSESDEACKYLISFSEMCPKKESSKNLLQSISILNCINLLLHDDVKQLSKLLDSVVLDSDGSETYHYFELGVLANLQSISQQHFFNFSEARRYAIQGESMGIKGNAAFSSAYSTSLLALALIQEGEAELAVHKLKVSLDSQELKIQGSFASASLSAIYGLALYETGQFIEAESHLSDTIDIITKTLPLDWVILATLSLFRARSIIEGSHKFSLEILDRAEKHAILFGLSRFTKAIEIERHRLKVCESSDYSHDLSIDIDFPQNDKNYYFLSEGTHDQWIYSIRHLISTNNLENAIQILESTLDSEVFRNWKRRELKLHILLSISYKKSGDNNSSIKTLEKAASIFQETGLTGSFVEEGSFILKMVDETKDISQNSAIQNLAHKLGLKQDDNSTPGLQPNKSNLLIEQLTKRELDILKLVAKGSTNTEISEILFISYNTVKFHMKNLYGKLGAKNRIGLISEASNNSLI